MMGVNRLDRLISLSLGLLSLGAVVGFPSTAKAQPPACYMVTQAGQLIDLSSICGVEATPNRPQSNEFNGQQAPSNSQNSSLQNYNQQTLTQQSPPGQPGNFAGQQTFALPGTVATPTGGNGYRDFTGFTGFTGASGYNNAQWQPINDSTDLRSEPNGGSLITQLRDGQPVRPYNGLRSGNFVMVETQSGQRGWINLWQLPNGFGISP
ncbi:SH3 domain-containing protein [Gloeothece verrucosa]|uniref:Uncharacterized protein n=1 Tax=Gloeothece verrucosa (strain PCC 7822) TaxID=497965 RepID=E0UF73_GLOV7|nr:SH3 domain-containing protein [Gloeothece verrucosa]ADN15444.1 hypothetical protein Cyan7822_3502 [Gloeothece verrucosa PCC 7822]